MTHEAIRAADLPDWPAALPERLAAAYLGMIGTGTLRRRAISTRD